MNIQQQYLVVWNLSLTFIFVSLKTQIYSLLQRWLLKCQQTLYDCLVVGFFYFLLCFAADSACCLTLFVVWQFRSQLWQCWIFNCHGRWPIDFIAVSSGSCKVCNCMGSSTSRLARNQSDDRLRCRKTGKQPGWQLIVVRGKAGRPVNKSTEKMPLKIYPVPSYFPLVIKVLFMLLLNNVAN